MYLSTMNLGIKTLGNCVKIAELKVEQTVRNFFFKWHSNTFNKSILNNVVENALTVDY